MRFSLALEELSSFLKALLQSVKTYYINKTHKARHAFYLGI